jgi:hypothetical protein
MIHRRVDVIVNSLPTANRNWSNDSRTKRQITGRCTRQNFYMTAQNHSGKALFSVIFYTWTAFYAHPLLYFSSVGAWKITGRVRNLARLPRGQN